MGLLRCTFSGLRLKPLFILVGVTALVGCQAQDLKGVGITVVKTSATPTPTPSVSPSPGSSSDTTAPTLTIVAPSATGQSVTSSSLTVSGTASDTSGISLVTVNGVAATGTTSWSRTITLSSGSNSITVVATDNSSNRNTRSQTITSTYSAPTPSLTPAASGAPSAPTSLVMFSPIVNYGTSAPTITVNGVTSGNSVRVSSDDSTCGTLNGVATASGSSVNVAMSYIGGYGAHTLYAKQVTPEGVSSPCSTASLTYLFGVPPAPV